MNLVSREKAIDVAIDEYNRGYKEGFEAASLKWIPCRERLPESENMYERPKHRYLCQRSVCGVNQMFVGARLNHPKGLLDDFWDWYGTKFRDEDVIAWMPLPDPYKERREEHD